MGAVRTLEYVGEMSPFRDAAAFVAAVKRQRPGISQRGIDEVVSRVLLTRKPRINGHVVHLWGADILTDDLANIPAAQWAEPSELAQIGALPIRDRVGLIDPRDPGLSRSYVWRWENDWIQQVTAADVEVIRGSDARAWFRDPHRADGPYRDARSFDFPVTERETFANGAEFRDFMRDQERIPQWSGV